MIAVVWQFDVRSGKEKEFEKFYGVDGEWTAMNSHSRSYLGTSFLRDQSRTTRYMVIEYWSEMLVYEEHKSYRRDQLETLEKQQQALVTSVEPLGLFTALDVPENRTNLVSPLMRSEPRRGAA